MYQLYIANKNYSSWSLRPWVLMQQLAIPFVEHLQPFHSPSNNAAFRMFSPTGKVPCLIDENTIVWDSLAITEYIAEQYIQAWPEDKITRAWARSVCAQMHSNFNTLRQSCPMCCGLRVKIDITPELESDLFTLSKLWQEGLTRFGGPFLTGNYFTAADAFFAPIAFRVQTYDLPLEGMAMDYVQRLLSLSAMKKWYHEALIEPWEDEQHYQQISAAGIIIADLRENKEHLIK